MHGAVVIVFAAVFAAADIVVHLVVADFIDAVTADAVVVAARFFAAAVIDRDSRNGGGGRSDRNAAPTAVALASVAEASVPC